LLLEKYTTMHLASASQMITSIITFSVNIPVSDWHEIVEGRSVGFPARSVPGDIVRKFPGRSGSRNLICTLNSNAAPES
jgi:hypothetical protein